MGCMYGIAETIARGGATKNVRSFTSVCKRDVMIQKVSPLCHTCIHHTILSHWHTYLNRHFHTLSDPPSSQGACQLHSHTKPNPPQQISSPPPPHMVPGHLRHCGCVQSAQGACSCSGAHQACPLLLSLDPP